MYTIKTQTETFYEFWQMLSFDNFETKSLSRYTHYHDFRKMPCVTSINPPPIFTNPRGHHYYNFFFSFFFPGVGLGKAPAHYYNFSPPKISFAWSGCLCKWNHTVSSVLWRINCILKDEKRQVRELCEEG